ncbi:RND family transporter [Mycobacterium sp. PDNC021]|uniref:MMPL/RND family transporter n=1 Tax=Mycobacterium sp. PDNC021 TaxID=3391399 RepID=UPI003AAD4B35
MAHQYSPTFEHVGRFVSKHAIAVALFWIGIAALTNLGWPQLETVANERSVNPLPSESVSPALKSMKEMAKSFGQPGIDNAIVIIMKSDNGFDDEARIRYAALVQRLHGNTQSVTFVRDLLNDSRLTAVAQARSQVMSADGKAWFVVIGLRGDLGSPEAARSFRSVDDLVRQTFAGSPVEARLTGMSATMNDLALMGIHDLPKVGVVSVVVVGIILLIVFRSVFTAGLPLVVMGVSLLVARGVVAGLASEGIIPISSVSGALMMAVLMGASVNYTMFLVGRYHERLRAGEAVDDALAHSCGSMARVILAAAATVAIANIAQLTAKLQFLAAVGPAVCIAVVVAFLVAVTLLPATLHLAARRGLCLAGTDRTRATWRRIGVFVVRRSRTVLAASAVILVGLALSAITIRPSYDMTASIPPSMPSAQGMKILTEHFPADVTMPQYVLVHALTDMRTPQGLADLDNMAARISQLPGVNKVVGLTRPDGNKITEATLAWQIGYMGSRMHSTSGKLDHQLQPQLERMQKIADVISAMMSQLNTLDLPRLQKSVAQTMALAQQMTDQTGLYQQVLEQIGKSAPLFDQLTQAGPSLQQASDALDSVLTSTGPAAQALNDSPLCADNPSCDRLRAQLVTLMELKNTGLATELRKLSITAETTGSARLEPLIDDVNSQLTRVRGMLDKVPDYRRQYETFNGYIGELQALGVDVTNAKGLSTKLSELNAQMRDSMAAMTEAAAYLQTIGKEAGTPNGSGFYLPAAIMQYPDFKTAAEAFIRDDGHTAMYMIQSTLNPYGEEAMALSRTMARVASEATPNTSLAGSTVSIGGFPAMNADLNTVFNQDFAEIVVVALLIIFVVMCLLLRAVVAPIYLLGTVILTYGAALGLGVLVFQQVLGLQIQWAIPAMTFVLIAAVGADYNMLFISRLREESTLGVRLGILRTVGYTGSVITSAGLVFAATLLGMMSASIDQMVQLGFIIGIGILLDTFVVRTLMVPALAKIFGQLSWWPARSEEATTTERGRP